MKMVGQGYNYSDGRIHSFLEFMETRIEKPENSISPSVTSRNSKKSKKESKKRKLITFADSENEDLEDEQKGKKFCPHRLVCYVKSASQASKTE